MASSTHPNPSAVHIACLIVSMRQAYDSRPVIPIQLQGEHTPPSTSLLMFAFSLFARHRPSTAQNLIFTCQLDFLKCSLASWLLWATISTSLIKVYNSCRIAVRTTFLTGRRITTSERIPTSFCFLLKGEVPRGVKREARRSPMPNA
jgi:hypothetical protein